MLPKMVCLYDINIYLNYLKFILIYICMYIYIYIDLYTYIYNYDLCNQYMFSPCSSMFFFNNPGLGGQPVLDSSVHCSIALAWPSRAATDWAAPVSFASIHCGFDCPGNAFEGSVLTDVRLTSSDYLNTTRWLSTSKVWSISETLVEV